MAPVLGSTLTTFLFVDFQVTGAEQFCSPVSDTMVSGSAPRLSLAPRENVVGSEMADGAGEANTLTLQVAFLRL